MVRPGDPVTVIPMEGIGEITAGTDLGALLCGLSCRDGDVVVVTSKVVSKAEGRTSTRDREDVVTEQTVRLVARRGGTRIVENPLGLVLAAAGVDSSNVASATVLLLPEDPDASARSLRARVYDETGQNVAVVISDTAGRTWRTGQTDLAIGVAGLEPVESFAGQVDAHGNPLVVTAPATADEVASAAELATGKLGGRPVSVVRGLARRVLPPGEHGPGARALLRPRNQDMFALGSREAVLAALSGHSADCFGSPATAEELRATLEALGVPRTRIVAHETLELLVHGLDAVGTERVRLAAHASAWRAAGPTQGTIRLSRAGD